ncbi:MAG: hypothetical protein NC250_00145 [Alistipes senegalensis]|nr:hypothetical protein [Bacteroides cellulosilyticus]MCM1351134.1 hypothetical protein [Alistipes senegalensis]
MNRKLKLALAALLGFSTACSTVKNASSKKTDDAAVPADTVEVAPRVVVMYGVRPPVQSTGHRSLSSVLQENDTATEAQDASAAQQPETSPEN